MSALAVLASLIFVNVTSFLIRVFIAKSLMY